MKTKSFYFILFTILVSACSQKKEYTLAGTFAQPDNEGATVYLWGDEEGANVMDSSVVTDNKFTFRGVASDSLQVAFVSYAKKYAPLMFVIEEGDITMSVDTAFLLRMHKTGGTPANIDLEEYRDRFWTMMVDSGKFGQEEEAAFAGGLTEEEMKDWAQRRENILNEIEDLTCNFIEKHAKDQLGEQIFLRDTYFIRPDKVEKVKALLRPGFTGLKPEKEKKIAAAKATQPGQEYVDVKGYDINGNEITFSDFVGKGNVVLVDFWASWCGPCIAALPELKEFYAKNKDKGLVVLGVSLDDDKEAWINATEKHNIEWPQLSNLKGWDDPAATLYGINGIPHTILIGKDGIIAVRNIEGNRLQAMFDELSKK